MGSIYFVEAGHAHKRKRTGRDFRGFGKQALHPLDQAAAVQCAGEMVFKRLLVHPIGPLGLLRDRVTQFDGEVV